MNLYMLSYRFLLYLFSACLFSFFGCKKDDSNPVGNNNPSIKLGQTLQVAASSVAPSGGTVIVDKPGNQLHGLTITVEAGSYSDTRTFTISSTPIESHTLGQYFNPITPLIRFDNGGGYTEQPMLVTIPIKVPQEYFAMPFFYDRTTGELEGIPIVELTDTSITLCTRHFNNPKAMASGLMKRGANSLSVTGTSFAEILITMVAMSSLSLDNDYDSFFRPGIDDWEFINYGSHLAPKGHCMGQSMGMLWYYSERSRTDGKLFGRFDNDRQPFRTPKIMQDDVSAYRFCSVLQNDANWLTVSNTILDLLQRNPYGDLTTMRMFRYSILLTRKPQMIAIYGDQGGSAVGHALAVYRAKSIDLFTADPNFPGDGNHVITLNGVKFDAYNTKANASDPQNIAFKSFWYIGASALMNYSTIATRWRSVLDKTIGDDLFPKYTLKILNDNVEFVPLTDNFSLSQGDITISVKGDGFKAKLRIINIDGAYLSNGSLFTLPDGIRKIGIEVQDDATRWVDFKWYTLQIGQTGQYYLEWTVDGVPLTSDLLKSYISRSETSTRLWFYHDDHLDSSVVAEYYTVGSVGTWIAPSVDGGKDIYLRWYIDDPYGPDSIYIAYTRNSCRTTFTAWEYDWFSDTGWAEGTFDYQVVYDKGKGIPDFSKTRHIVGKFKLPIKI